MAKIFDSSIETTFRCPLCGSKTSLPQQPSQSKESLDTGLLENSLLITAFPPFVLPIDRRQRRRRRKKRKQCRSNEAFFKWCDGTRIRPLWSLSLSRCRGTLHPLSTISLSLSIEDSVHRGALVRLWNVSHPFWSKIADELLTSSKNHRFWLEYPMCRRINEHQRSSIDRWNGCLQSKWLINDECRRRSAWYRSKVRFFVRLKIDVLDLILDRIIRMIWRCAVFRSSMWNQCSWFSIYFVFLSNWILTSEDVQLPKMSKNRSKKEKKSTAKALSRCHELPSERTRTKHRENAPEVGNVWQPKKMTTRMNRRMGRKWWKKENQSTEKRNDPTNRFRQSDGHTATSNEKRTGPVWKENHQLDVRMDMHHGWRRTRSMARSLPISLVWFSHLSIVHQGIRQNYKEKEHNAKMGGITAESSPWPSMKQYPRQTCLKTEPQVSFHLTRNVRHCSPSFLSHSDDLWTIAFSFSHRSFRNDQRHHPHTFDHWFLRREDSFCLFVNTGSDSSHCSSLTHRQYSMIRRLVKSSNDRFSFQIDVIFLGDPIYGYHGVFLRFRILRSHEVFHGIVFHFQCPEEHGCPALLADNRAWRRLIELCGGTIIAESFPHRHSSRDAPVPIRIESNRDSWIGIDSNRGTEHGIDWNRLGSKKNRTWIEGIESGIDSNRNFGKPESKRPESNRFSIPIFLSIYQSSTSVLRVGWKSSGCWLLASLHRRM